MGMNCAEFSYILLDNALNEDSSDWGWCQQKSVNFNAFVFSFYLNMMNEKETISWRMQR